jgi:hypothetical protein
MSPATLRALAAQAHALAELLAAAAAEGASDPAIMVSEADAAALASVSVRVLRAARRAGELTFYGKQRSRTVRRADLLAWIESRRAPVVRDVVVARDPSAADEDLGRRMKRLEEARRAPEVAAAPAAGPLANDVEHRARGRRKRS